MTICAPFTLTDHAGLTWVTRHGQRLRVASPEAVRLWAERNGHTDGTIETVTTAWGYIIEFRGDWAHDAALCEEVAAALKKRAEMLRGDAT